MPRLDRLPEILHSAPFTVAEALEFGTSYGELCHRSVVSLSRGIKTLNDATDLPLALLTRPYTLVTGYSAASHSTALTIWGIPGYLPKDDGNLVDISRQFPHVPARRRGVRGHRTMFRDDEVCLFNGLWITTRARTWLDCARKMPVDELVVAADHLLRLPRPVFEGRTEPYATTAELAVLLERHPGTPGIVKAREALRLARVGSDSPPETRLRLACGFAGLPEPLLNTTIVLADGVERTPDQSYPEYKVAVEYDGATHADPNQVEKDIRREEDFAKAGWKEVRIMKRHMDNDAKEAVRKVRNALWDRGWRPS
ncbi:hypothetical protein AL755_15310 [Arthrobacter sp. ERGS1:01]|uniref:endonuclease domain-containing protein n=1 Tax=Arthrobacter sp. ERGS1:01 TaxID=1704044 RepID=UPI0006B4B05D|nr:DUF559 domain-containing protein [Arthrobacter sp. ERGS1:01]ALE06505.1 hypothetical protein AL755_15310 [Arthrobacter sp. ERGS1:01]